MATENDSISVSASHQDLSFDSTEFLKKSFSTDAFLQEHRNKTSLETLRDDLGIYLRILRSSMIELINKDYADFVNLSTNLIGLDRAINGMQSPLGQLKEEIFQVKAALEESLKSVSDLLMHRHDVLMRMWCLQNLLKIEFFLRNFENVLDSKEETNKYFSLPDLIERVALEYNKTMSAIFQCEPYVSEMHVKKTSEICDNMMSSLNDMFLEYLKRKDINAIARCLRTYVALGKVHEAEMLYRKNAVAPAVRKIISETAMQSSMKGLNSIYNQLIDFVEVEMKTILELIKVSRRHPAVKSFNFVLNSFWTEVEQRLEIDLPSIFSPGNPDLFHRHFTETGGFMKKLQYFCELEGSINKLHSHPQYHLFIQKWNLSVYFQIRFKQLAGPVELVLSNRDRPWIKLKGSIFQLKVSHTVWNYATKCWADGIFLKQLTPNFSKLTLLIFARYTFWINTVLQKWPANVEDAASGPPSVVKEAQEKNAQQNLQNLVCLYNDLETLVGKLPTLYRVAMHRVDEDSDCIQMTFQENLDTTGLELQELQPKVTQTIVNEVSHHSIMQLKHVSDIPRLYRRTNREIPTKACPYVLQMLEPPKLFKTSYVVSPQLCLHWSVKIYSNITKHFLIAVNDVLTSVQKTEESLRRLKKFRDKSTSANPTDFRGIGDDDKIRIQIALDVRTYCKEVEKSGLNRSKVQHLEQLMNLVDDATSKYNIL